MSSIITWWRRWRANRTIKKIIKIETKENKSINFFN